jgi:hypothetical protein
VIKDLYGKDPYRTVCVKGFPEDAMYYHTQLKRMFIDACDNDAVQFHYEKQRAFVEFKDSSDMRNKIANGVYLSMVLPWCGISLKRVIFDQSVFRELEQARSAAAVGYRNSSTARITTG